MARQDIIGRILDLKKHIHSSELFHLLPPQTKKSIEEADQRESNEFSEKIREAGRKRTEYQ